MLPHLPVSLFSARARSVQIVTYPELFSNSAFENGVFYNISESASLRYKVVSRLSSTLKNGALLTILSEFPLIHFLFAFALINCLLYSWSQGTGINAISLRSWRFRWTFMANRQKAKSMLREEWWESEWERNRLPASLSHYSSVAGFAPRNSTETPPKPLATQARCD